MPLVRHPNTCLTRTIPTMPAEPQHNTPASDEQARQWLSACADGEADALDPACQLWRDDPAARQTWHRYHLIGDVLRSEELATSPARDAAFLSSLRQRLAAEPVALAPSARANPGAGRPSWRLPAALAASFVLVAGAFTVARLRPVSPGGEAGAAAGAGTVLDQADRVADEAGLPLITDPRLDEFLRAHQAMGGGLQAAAPGGALRQVRALAPTLMRP
jgi:sigma-E factor negative regulatory protein RseA